MDYREKNNITRNDFLQLLIQLKNKGKIDDADEGIEVEKSINSKYMSLFTIFACLESWWKYFSGTALKYPKSFVPLLFRIVPPENPFVPLPGKRQNRQHFGSANFTVFSACQIFGTDITLIVCSGILRKNYRPFRNREKVA